MVRSIFPPNGSPRDTEVGEQISWAKAGMQSQHSKSVRMHILNWKGDWKLDWTYFEMETKWDEGGKGGTKGAQTQEARERRGQNYRKIFKGF